MRKIKNKAKTLKLAAKKHEHEVKRAQKRALIHRLITGSSVPGKLGKFHRRYIGERMVHKLNEDIAARVMRAEIRAQNKAEARKSRPAITGISKAFNEARAKVAALVARRQRKNAIRARKLSTTRVGV